MSPRAKDIFLAECCKIAKGNTTLTVSIATALDEANASYNYAYVTDVIIPSLISEDLLKKVAGKEEIVLSRKAYYYIIEITRVPASKFNMVSYNEAKTLSLEVLKKLCIQGKLDLHKVKFSAYCGETMNQVIDILEGEKLIEYINNHGTARISEKGRIVVLKNLTR